MENCQFNSSLDFIPYHSVYRKNYINNYQYRMTNNTNESGDNFITGTGFQVPSFGDEDFDLLQVPLILPSEQAASHDNNHTYNTQSQAISHQQITTIDSHVTMASNMQQSNNVFSNIGNPSNVTPKFPPQNYYDPDINMTNTFQESNPSFDGGNVFQSVAITTSQGMFQGQSGQSQMVTAGQQQPLSTICHSQISNHLGFQAPGVNQASPQDSVSPNRESTSEDSDDSLPLAQLVSLKRQAAVSSDIQHVNNSPAAPSLPVNTTPTAPAPKKMKTPKRKKKKDPNEPQKPVSAYALFFRDTQAAIKGQNPSASFGEVSKIVASMWDGLDPDHKNVYKKKTEMAKKEYLKQLAAYRASQVSLAAVEEANSANEKSPPYQDSMKISQGNQLIGENSQMMTQMSSPQVINYSPPHQQTLQHFQPSQQNNNMIYQSQNQADYGGRIGSSMCIRNGCVNNAINNPCWDEEYCSSECVVSHCRDVFTAWVANRQVSTSFPVK